MKPYSPLISICLINYNQGKYLNFLLDSIRNQNYTHVEHIFTDDCSTDNSVDIIKQSNLNSLTILESKNNMGPSLNANKYIREANGEFIAGVCCDDGFLPEKLNIQVEAFEKDPSIGAVFTLPSLIDEDNQPLPDDAYPIFFNKNYKTRFEFLQYFFLNCNFLLGPSMLIKKACYDSVGLYDSRYLQLQDYEFYIRLCLAGHEIKLIEEPLTYYRIRDNKKNLSAQSHRFLFLQEIILILKEHYSTIEDPILLNNIFPMIPLDDIHLMKFDLAMIALKTAQQWHQLFGLDLLYQLFKDEEVIQLIAVKRQFYPPDLYALTND